MTYSENTLVSVIIPAFNAAEFIEMSVISALRQTHSCVEIIVVDDGSLDDTAAIVRRLSLADRRVRFFQHSQSMGPSAARNTAVTWATGEWIAPLDADDSFAPERLAYLLQAADEQELDAVADNLLILEFGSDSVGEIAFPEDWMRQGEALTLQRLLERDYPGRNAFPSFGLIKPIMKRSFLDRKSLRYEPEFRIGEDFLLYSKLLLSGARFGLVEAAHYNYFRRKGSISFDRSLTMQLIEVNRVLRDLMTSAAQGVLLGNLQ